MIESCSDLSCAESDYLQSYLQSDYLQSTASPESPVSHPAAASPQETCVISHSWDYRPGAQVAIGRPIPGYVGLILDARGRALPPGVPGELCVGGPAVAAGYLNRPELTARPFVEAREPVTGFEGRLYRTGDLVRFDGDGEVVFLGRIDSQVRRDRPQESLPAGPAVPLWRYSAASLRIEQLQRLAA